MAMFIVSYRRDAEGVCCTNIAVAENREQVEAEYGECDFIAINPAKVHEVEALRQRGCPVVECAARKSAQERAEEALRIVRDALDRLDWAESGCAGEVPSFRETLEKLAEALA